MESAVEPNNNINKMKKQYVDIDQKMALIEFVKAHSELNSAKLSTGCTNERKKQLWNKIAEKLNSMPGSIKTADKWKKVSLFL